MYYYITSHGIGGTLPKGVIIDSLSYEGMKTIIKTDSYISREDLDKYDLYRYCPVCKKRFLDEPAISRIDNKTGVCSECGVVEALNQYECYIS